MLGVAVGQQRVGVVDGSGEQAKEDVERDLGSDQRPEVLGEVLAAKDVSDVLNDVPRDYGDG